MTSGASPLSDMVMCPVETVMGVLGVPTGFSQYRQTALRSMYQFVIGVFKPTKAPQFLHHRTMFVIPCDLAIH